MYIGLGFPGTTILIRICFPYFRKVWKAYAFQNSGTRKPQSYIHINLYIGLGFSGTTILERICFPYIWKIYTFGKYILSESIYFRKVSTFGKYILLESIYFWKVYTFGKYKLSERMESMRFLYILSLERICFLYFR